jgi:hypothetical protein
MMDDVGAPEGGAAEGAPPCYTPQQVRFTDARGVLWTVRCAHRLADAGAAGAPVADGPPSGLPVLIDDEGSRIAACRAGRCWLEFASAAERRRLRLVPPRWYTLSPTALALLCEEADVEVAAEGSG